MIRHRFGRCTFDPNAGTVTCGSHELPLTVKSAELLGLLLEHPNEVIASDVLRERLWPSGYVEPGNLAQQVYLLRRALAIDPTIAIENVARRGYRLRAELYRSPVAASSWATTHRRSVLAAGLAAAALIALPGGASLVSTRHVAQSPGARTYALGRAFWERRGNDNIDRAETFFRQTIAAEPTSALGYAGLSEVWGLRADADMTKPRHMRYAVQALSYAQTALARDPNSGVAHAALGLALMESNRDDDGVSELRRAIALDPSNPEAHEWYAIQLLVHGNVRAAATHFEAAAEAQPENVAITTWRAWVRYYLRDFDSAAGDFRTALALNPSFGMARIGLAAALLKRGAYREVKVAMADVHLHDWSTARALNALGAIADLHLGRRADADAMAVRLQGEARSRPSSDDEFVVAALALDGRRSEARSLRARMHLKAQERRMIALDPLVGPVFRDLGGDV